MRRYPDSARDRSARACGRVDAERDVPEPAAKGPERRGGLTVQVTMEPGNELAGSVAAGEGEAPIAFFGWLGLIEALQLVRRRAGLEVAHLPSPGD